jgi:hypothetical protein
MAPTSGIATLGRLGDVLEQPAKSAAASEKTARRVSREHRMKNVPNREIRWFRRTHSAASLCFDSGQLRTICGRFAWCPSVHKTAAATEQGQNPPEMNAGRRKPPARFNFLTSKQIADQRSEDPARRVHDRRLAPLQFE